MTALGCLLPARQAVAHPLHTTLTEITDDRTRGVTRAMIRVFASDLGMSMQRFAHASNAVGSPAWDAAAITYATSVFSISTKAGAAMPLRPCGVTRTAEVVWICLEVSAPGGIASLQVRNAMLCDQFEDQINVVQATYAGSRHSVMFTRGDKAKPLS